MFIPKNIHMTTTYWNQKLYWNIYSFKLIHKSQCTKRWVSLWHFGAYMWFNFVFIHAFLIYYFHTDFSCWFPSSPPLSDFISSTCYYPLFTPYLIEISFFSQMTSFYFPDSPKHTNLNLYTTQEGIPVVFSF